MRDFKEYDEVMTSYYAKMSNYVLPLLSWEFYGENHIALQAYKDDLVTLNQITKNWDFEKNYIEELVDKESVIVITNTDLKIVYASKNIEKLNGYSPEEVIGNSPKMFQGADTCAETTKTVRAAVDNAAPFEVSILNYRKDKTPYVCLIKGFPILNKKGKLINYIAFEKAA
ncbi:PAS domain-containing protein [Aquimarina sp. D1M17]|uniref:PAS domain-containing protein n=1 Tax=Aquimarina acroporae TaxID=2937283 RepID=UPI0020BE027D|nr:PAS domain-containing protein [Aquimarina acroporae]MCK8522719.1 PAS domain-containing protein [Aquimarina acroporae]